MQRISTYEADVDTDKRRIRAPTHRRVIKKNVFSSTIPSLHVSIACSGNRSGCRRIINVRT